MTFTIKRGFALAFLAVVFIAAVTFSIGYLSGQAQRKSDEAVALLVSHEATETKQAVNAERDIRQVQAVRKAVKKAEHAQWRKDNKRWKTYVAKERKRVYDKGYDAGHTAGYGAGNSAGYSSGHTTGVQDGIEEGSDELTCSDDKDVPLPPCSFYDY